jgi:hypothetical protein
MKQAVAPSRADGVFPLHRSKHQVMNQLFRHAEWCFLNLWMAGFGSIVVEERPPSLNRDRFRAGESAFVGEPVVWAGHRMMAFLC